MSPPAGAVDDAGVRHDAARSRPATAAAAQKSSAAAGQGFSVRAEGHLLLIEGIGPKIEALLNQGGMRTFRELSACGVDQLRSVLTMGGPGFKLAAAGNWAQLRKLQDQVIGGVERAAG